MNNEEIKLDELLTEENIDFISMKDSMKIEIKDNMKMESEDKQKTKVLRKKILNVTEELTDKEYLLYENLRNLRYELAKEEHVPPYIIFSNKTLANICIRQPHSLEEILEVKGVGEKKREKYGEKFIDAILQFEQQSPAIRQQEW
ncbi:MAG: HRDC domain-containing protein [Eubacteriales bacterium]|nr:HRDC domain-containing protein [Eubacteriales bacterium]